MQSLLRIALNGLNDMRLALNPVVKILQESFTLGIEPNSRRSGFRISDWVKSSFITKMSETSMLISPCWNYPVLT